MTKTSDMDDYDFGPYEDEYRGFDPRAEDTNRGPLILMLALGVLLIFAGVIWNTYRQGVRSTDGGLPIIMADSESYKRAPEKTTGSTIDEPAASGVYGLMEGESKTPRAQKVAVRNPVQPAEPEVPLSGGPDAASGSKLTGPRDLLRPKQGADTMEEPKVRLQAEATLPVEDPNANRQPASMTTRPTRFSDVGNYQIQLSAVRSDTAARNAWKTISDAHADMFYGAKLDVQRADLGPRGVFYRVRVDAFETRAKAKSFCSDLKSRNQDCMVVAKVTG